MNVSYISKWLSIPLVIGLLLLPVLVVSTPLARPSQEPVSTLDNTSTLLFVENAGQFAEGARFLVSGANGGALWLADDGLWFTLVTREDVMREDVKRVNVKITFTGANAHPHLEPFDRQDTVFNYYHGDDPAHWYADVPVWGGVRYVDLYPGVDLEITGEGNHWAWRLVTRNSPPAASTVRLRVEGADNVLVDSNYLHLSTAGGDLSLPLLTLDSPQDWGARGAGTAPTSQPKIVAEEGNTFDITSPFTSPSPNPSQSIPTRGQPTNLPIYQSPISRGASPQGGNLQSPTSNQSDNPDALLFSTFLGGDDEERAYALAVDGGGDIYVTGYTKTPTFPTTPGAFDTSFDGDSEIFVSRLNTDGSDLLYSTFLGGTTVVTDSVHSEVGWDIAIDGAGAAYIVGESSNDDFPTTPGAYSQTYIPASPDDVFPGSPPSQDLVIVKLDAAGALAYGTYFAPTLADGMGIAVNDTGVYVAGLVAASAFPTTEGAYNRTFGYGPDFFVLKFNLAGQGQDDLRYSTYVAVGATPMQPGAYEGFGDMTVADGVVYVVGSTGGDFPTTPGAYDTTFNGELGCVGPSILCPANVVFFKLNPAGNGAADMLYSTYLGGTATIVEWGQGIAVDAAGMVYLAGHTGVDDFPTTPGAFDTTGDGFWGDAFVSKLNPAGNGAADLEYSTYLGGSYLELLGSRAAIAVDDAGDIYVIGTTYSSDFPVTPGAFQSTRPGDIFVTRLRSGGAGPADLIYSTYLGGGTMDFGRDIVAGPGETVYVAGYTNSSDFPITAGAYDTTFGGGTCGSYPCYDVFVAKIKAVPKYEITGKVTDTDGNALLGIQVSAGGGYVGTTGTSGEYTISDLPDGSYTVKPITPGYLWSPESRPVSVPPGASGQDFVETRIQKGSTPVPGTILDFGDVLTYTVMLLFSQDTTQVLYDQVPTYTTYLSGSLVAPAGLVYDAATNTISGTLSLTPSLLTTVTFAVRVAVTGTAEFAPLITNRACVYPPGGGLADCEWSNEVWNSTYVGAIYLPLVTRNYTP